MNDCNKSCGRGSQTFGRRQQVKSANGGKDCVGDDIKVTDCNRQPCPSRSLTDCCDSIEIYYNGPLKYTYASIYGYYVRQEDLIHGRPWYKNDYSSIWWDDEGNDWNLGKNAGSNGPLFAYMDNHGRCPAKISDQKWKLFDGSNFNDAQSQDVKVRCGYKPQGKEELKLIVDLKKNCF